MIRVSGVAAAALLVAACGRTPSPDIFLTSPPAPPAVEVRGLPAGDLRALARSRITNAQWQAILRVEVERAAGIPVAGSYQAQRGAIRFTPMYGFDAGRTYIVTFDPSRIPNARRARWRASTVQRTFTIDQAALTRTTYVSQVSPSGEVLPENMLRFYIEFSEPMGRGSALDHIRLIEQGGPEVMAPFLPVEAEFWNPERTRFTLFFDPGRVKLGIKPNRDLGRALVSGRRYELVIDDGWLDARGQRLKSGYSRVFRAGPARDEALDVAKWKVEVPATSATRDPLTVTFPWGLDAGLLRRAITVVRSGRGGRGSGTRAGGSGVENRGSGIEVQGDVRLELGETRWVFNPRNPWVVGNYSLVVLTLLEDPAGNRIGRAFEVMKPVTESRESLTIPFAIR